MSVGGLCGESRDEDCEREEEVSEELGDLFRRKNCLKRDRLGGLGEEGLVRRKRLVKRDCLAGLGGDF